MLKVHVVYIYKSIVVKNTVEVSIIVPIIVKAAGRLIQMFVLGLLLISPSRLGTLPSQGP